MPLLDARRAGRSCDGSGQSPARRRRQRQVVHPLHLAPAMRHGIEDQAAGEAEEGEDHEGADQHRRRSEEHTSELQSLMRISYAVFCLKKKIKHNIQVSESTTQSLSTHRYYPPWP